MNATAPVDRVPVITIDGPSGSGKGTLAQRLAKRLGWALLDSGALYRLVGLAADRHGVSLDDEDGLAALARHLDVRFEPGDADSPTQVWLEGENVSDRLRSERAGTLASHVAVVPAVREALLSRQRAFRQPPGLVADGRDMGTTVFPDAELKIFLTASVQARAERRYKQLNAKGQSVNLAPLLRDLQARDERDRRRSLAPLVPADDAIRLDSTDMTIDGVTEAVLTQARQRGLCA